jgi:hypothetical protein
MDYYNRLYGKSIGKNYMIAYSPETHDKKPVWAGEWSLSQAASVDNNSYSHDMIGHQVFHR